MNQPPVGYVNRRCTDWYPEGVHDAALAMCNDMGSLADECVQFDVGPVPQSQPVGPTVRCRIAVAVNTSGQWVATGLTGYSDEDAVADLRAQRMLKANDRISFVEASVPLPVRVEPVVIEGRVVE